MVKLSVAPSAESTRALKRLWTLATGDCGQSRVVAQFLLGLYDGRRFPFDLTCLRTLEPDVYLDCLRVLQSEYQPESTLPLRLGVPDEYFEQLALNWRLHD